MKVNNTMALEGGKGSETCFSYNILSKIRISKIKRNTSIQDQFDSHVHYARDNTN